MGRVDFSAVISAMKGSEVDRPNKATSGTLSGHAAGEPFEKSVYKYLKGKYPNNISKQFEFLNALYMIHPECKTFKSRYNLLPPTAAGLLCREPTPTARWSFNNLFEEKQNDTADIVYDEGDFYGIIDVKTRNTGKRAQAPNIISATKLASACASMIDTGRYDDIDIDYVEIEWKEENDKLRCVNAYHVNLFKAEPEDLYINWAAAMQIQFHVHELKQTWQGSREEWARRYLKHFVESAKKRCKKMTEDYVQPYLKYFSDNSAQESS